MKTRRIISTVIALIMLTATFSGITVFAREYAADVSINGVTVQFENEPYSENDIIYIPLEEIGRYLKLDIAKEGNTYSIARMGSVLKVESGNLVAFLDGKEILLSTNPVEKNGVTYIPVDLFSKGFGCPVTVSDNKRSADIVPDVYRVSIGEESAAAVSAAVKENDILGTGTGSVDAIFNNAAVFPELEKSVFYKIDLSAFENYKIAKVLLCLNIDKSEYSPTLRIVRTAPWNKGEVTYNTQPAPYESEYVNGTVAESNYVDKSYNITTLANSAKKAGETLSVKLMGIPHSSKVNSKNNSFTIRGVNTSKAPYAEVYLQTDYTFPVKADSNAEGGSQSKYNSLMLLKSLGVFTEKDEFPLDLGESVQRQEFVKYALRLRNAQVSEMSPDGIFTDVPKDSPFCNDIVTAYSLGLVSGGEGVSFRPYDGITVAEAITILGRMLNYNIYAEQNGQLPNIFNVSGNQLKQFIARGSVISLNELPGGEEFLKEYGQEGLEGSNLVDGKQYSVYMNMRTSGLAYNKELFKQAGIVDKNGEAKTPKTLKDVVKYAKKINELGADIYGFAFPLKFGLGYTVTSPLASYYDTVTAETSQTFLDLDTGKFDMSNTHEQYDWLFEMKKDGSLFPGAETLDNDTARAYFSAGTIGMIPAISWDVSVFNNQFKAECDWDICPYPAPEGREVYKQWCQRGGGMLIGRSAAEKAPEATMEVYKFIYSLETRTALFERGINLSAKNDVLEVYNKDVVDPRFVKFAELVDETKRFATSENYVLEGDNWQTMFQKVWMGEMTLDDAIKDYSARNERDFKKAVEKGEYDIERQKRVRRYLNGEDGLDISMTH